MLARRLIAPLISILIGIGTLQGSAEAQFSGASSAKQAKQAKKSPSISESGLEPGSVSAGVYRNPMLGISCKIPAGWVLRTEDMNARDADQSDAKPNKDAASGSGQVLLAAFSRPPQARAEDVNSSILIAAESASSYPGLKDAAQYFGPLIEITKAQGFAAVGDLYEFAVGTKTLPRGDFQKDVGTRVMRQSTLVMLTRGYVVSFTLIGGTEDEVEELIGGLSFTPSPKTTK
jgi:hypothetical protein